MTDNFLEVFQYFWSFYFPEHIQATVSYAKFVSLLLISEVKKSNFTVFVIKIKEQFH